MFEFLQNMYKQKRIDNDYLKKVVKKGRITAEQYKEITGIDYNLDETGEV